MEIQEDQLPFVADVDGAFRAMRADVRQYARDAETEWRLSLLEMLKSLALVGLPVEVCEGISSIVLEQPAKFIRGFLPVFQLLDKVMDPVEAMELELRHDKNPNLN